MTHAHQTISLGFTNQPFPPGVHICQIFCSNDERQASLLKFILSGLQSKERACCFSDNATEQAIGEFLGNYGISSNDVIDSGALTLAKTRDVYFKDNCFDPERMLSLLTTYYTDSVAQGYPAARVIGEMTPDIQHISGGNRLMEYESKITLLLRDHPVTAVCQYDSRSFDGAMIMDVLKVHPLMIVRGSVVHNPFCITPEEFLTQ
ncbi:MAG: MEDS domain-containing protein [Desulfuromonadales bacterium]|nr:MEDS domain-containing protein [Desulfuromonadales bacterium]